jgi:hypothetical protein
MPFGETRLGHTVIPPTPQCARPLFAERAGWAVRFERQDPASTGACERRFDHVRSERSRRRQATVVSMLESNRAAKSAIRAEAADRRDGRLVTEASR